MNTVDIRNLTRQTIIVRMPHQEVCVQAGRCFCHRNGSSGTVHLAAGGVTHDVPEAVMLSGEMKALLRGAHPAVRVTPTKVKPVQAGGPARGAGKGEEKSVRRKRRDAGDGETEI